MRDPITEAVLMNQPPDPISLREYLTYRLLLDGANIWVAIEAVASTAIEHSEWDMDEMKTWDEWESERTGGGL